MRQTWYVYELYDPRDNVVFYVGKGKGKRIDAHEKEARKGVCSHKCNKIRSLWSQNVEIGKRIVAVFWDEMAAYDHEFERIHSYDSLTNVMTNAIFGGMSVERPPKEKEYKIDHIGMLLKRPDILAQFLRFTKGKRGKVEIKCSGLSSVWRTMTETMWTFLFNDIYPKYLDIVSDSPTDWKRLQEALLPYGVILENGCKNETNCAF